MKKPILSVPIDKQLDRVLREQVRVSGLSRSDVVRQALKQYFGLVKKAS
jgi:Arc/MetJ-type ribon-helix-helix transcriptional regulator